MSSGCSCVLLHSAARWRPLPQPLSKAAQTIHRALTAFSGSDNPVSAQGRPHICPVQTDCRGIATSASPFLPLLLKGTLLGSRLFLFGGEDVTRRPQATLYVLDLADMEWQTVEATGVHEQALFADRASCLQPLQGTIHHLQSQGHPSPARTAGPCLFGGLSTFCAVQQHEVSTKMRISCWQPDRRCTALPARCCLMPTCVSSLPQAWHQLPGQHMWQQPTRDAIWSFLAAAPWHTASVTCMCLTQKPWSGLSRQWREISPAPGQVSQALCAAAHISGPYQLSL